MFFAIYCFRSFFLCFWCLNQEESYNGIILLRNERILEKFFSVAFPVGILCFFGPFSPSSYFGMERWKKKSKIEWWGEGWRVMLLLSDPSSSPIQSFRFTIACYNTGSGIVENVTLLFLTAFPGIVPNVGGRVLSDASGDRMQFEKALYVCGWLKRGPTGIIATNLYCAEETVSECFIQSSFNWRNYVHYGVICILQALLSVELLVFVSRFLIISLIYSLKKHAR